MDIDVKHEDYIDVEDAVHRIGGNRDLYKRLLGRFVDGNHFETLVNALDSGDMEEAAHLAHTLKGVSANLSLVKVMSITAELEYCIKEGADHTGRLAELREAYSVTLGLIAELMV